MARAAFCIASTVTQASQIVSDLRRGGFDDDAISVLYSDKGTSRDFAHTSSTKAPEGAAAGASAGGVLGAAVGWLAGIGSLAIPGAAPFVAAGPIMAALGGIGLGATVGGTAGALLGYGIPEFEARRFEGKVVGGGILVSVHVAGREERRRACATFAKHGGEDVAVADEARADFPVLEEHRA
jgi:hypothetical protein